ncbi:MAG: L-seryl-tRNA(Sec) selenium transferase, partial [Candidatus Hydrogenedentota bacterium]
MKKNPFLRAVRMDKLTLAALDATLRLYLNSEKAKQSIPVLKMLQAQSDDFIAIAEKLSIELNKIDEMTATVEESESYSGGGSLPQETIPTRIIRIEYEYGAEWLASTLRSSEIPIIGRIQNDTFVMDMRTLLDGDVDIIVEAFQELHA